MHISDPEERFWIMKEFEQLAYQPPTKEDKLRILEELTKSETFNQFLVSKYTTTKRFGIEGLDTVISGMSTSQKI
jgi:2-oxoglutarate dehydrogenase E1 component